MTSYRLETYVCQVLPWFLTIDPSIYLIWPKPSNTLPVDFQPLNSLSNQIPPLVVLPSTNLLVYTPKQFLPTQLVIDWRSLQWHLDSWLTRRPPLSLLAPLHWSSTLIDFHGSLDLDYSNHLLIQFSTCPLIKLSSDAFSLIFDSQLVRHLFLLTLSWRTNPNMGLNSFSHSISQTVFIGFSFWPTTEPITSSSSLFFILFSFIFLDLVGLWFLIFLYTLTHLCLVPSRT